MINLLSLLFPISCFGCGNSSSYLCSNCINTKINFNPIQKCASCNKPSPNGQTHTRCFTPQIIDGVYALTQKNTLITKLIKEFKYRHSHHIISAFKPIIQHLPNQFKSFDIIVPIPLHPNRLKQRGFNQSKLLAELISLQFSIPINDQILIKTKQTLPQADIHHRQSRIDNIKQAFEINSKIDKNIIVNQKILLIDDVSTTGATLNQASIPLKRNHASSVWGLVITR